MNADLHCHSTISDGLLSPAAVVHRAHANGVDLLALTDHDELGGLTEAGEAAKTIGLRFCPGVEISVSWGDDVTVHIVALGIDPQNQRLRQGLEKVRNGRDARAGRMAEELDKVGIHGAYEGALRHAGNPGLLSRAHLARYIVEIGRATDFKSVFDHWLAKGKPGYVPHAWASLEEALELIHGADGMAVMAHPGRYRVSRTELRQLLQEFKERGGAALEVLSGSQPAEDVRDMAHLARQFGFLASRGSDFHGPGESWTDLGRMAELPADLTPVWTRLA